MESVHGVDVSWLHRPNKDAPRRSRAPSAPIAPRDIVSPALSQDGSPNIPTTTTPQLQSPQLPNAIPDFADQPLERSISTPVTATSSEPSAARQSPRRPNLLNRSSMERMNGDRSGRKGSWISNISSKFSSSQQPSPGSPTVQTSKPQVNGINTSVTPQPARDQVVSPTKPQKERPKEVEELQPYVPKSPKDPTSSFFSSISRRLSTSSQSGATGKVAEHGGVLPRRILNKDPNRQRCLLPELDSTKLRRVSFSVDVEIASGPRYTEEEPVVDKQQKVKDRKMKERAEGESLKHPEAVAAVKEGDDSSPGEDSIAEVSTLPKIESDTGDATADDKDEVGGKDTNHKKEKKKRSEEERKERKEQKRRKAEESGQVPVELVTGDVTTNDSSSPSTTQQSGATTPKQQDRPTTDPVRIYRRCCQLRESPILKRITEQLMAPDCTVPGDPSTVTCLNLKGSRMQLPDVVTLGDWLAVVPVKRLILEDADLTDEGIRVVLAGLLASKKPQSTKTVHEQNGHDKANSHEERSGVIDRLTLKNNPRITRFGWKHITLFLYMCRSIRAIDLSMIQFPEDLPPSAQVTPIRANARSPTTTGDTLDAADLFSKAIAERLGGSRLEELGMSECGLTTQQLRKVIDAVTKCGTTRLGIAGNSMDDESFEHVLQYVQSGACEAIDIGSTDLRGKLGRLADALTYKPDCPVWGLSLAFCELDAEALQPLFPALVALSNLRFIDLSHNSHLFENGAAGGVQLLRKYIPQLRSLKRLHLMDVGLSTKQAIALAEILPEGPTLAHFNILENAELSALATSTDERSQEEACALYASLMSAARVSSTIICIDIDVPSIETSEVVKALAKQVVAYCLRNMEFLPLMESKEAPTSMPPKQHTDISVPDVLMHLVGHADGGMYHHDDGPAPDDDYIVGGTGVVKALQYCLSDNALPDVTTSTNALGSGMDVEKKGKAKDMSKNLLSSARKIRARLQPALAKEATRGDEMALRRLTFLDQTLQGMIQRFEDEFPETRLVSPSPKQAASLASSLESAPLSDATGLASSFATLNTDASALSNESDDDDSAMQLRGSRKNSDVNIAARALGQEEGRFHRLGIGIRRDIMNASGHDSPSRSGSVVEANAAGPQDTDSHLSEMAQRLENLSGNEVKQIVDRDGWDGVMQKVHANLDDLRQLQESDPVGWEQFKESQLKAVANLSSAQ